MASYKVVLLALGYVVLLVAVLIAHLRWEDIQKELKFVQWENTNIRMRWAQEKLWAFCDKQNWVGQWHLRSNTTVGVPHAQHYIMILSVEGAPVIFMSTEEVHEATDSDLMLLVIQSLRDYNDNKKENTDE